MPRRKPTITVPFTILRDDRERACGYRFAALTADAAQKNKPLVIPIEERRLITGDYSLLGFEDLVTVERKSLEDLYSTLGGFGDSRDRFEAEHQRMSQLAFAAVVIEADWATILTRPPERSRLNPKTVYRTAISWTQRYGVHWFAMPDRDLAEITTYHILRKFYEENCHAAEGQCQ